MSKEITILVNENALLEKYLNFCKENHIEVLHVNSEIKLGGLIAKSLTIRTKDFQKYFLKGWKIE
jgi:ribosomal protein L7Ae-like RNA K-turn-binding protein